jgi:hypothetical protein
MSDLDNRIENHPNFNKETQYWLEATKTKREGFKRAVKHNLLLQLVEDLRLDAEKQICDASPESKMPLYTASLIADEIYKRLNKVYSLRIGELQDAIERYESCDY